MCDCTRSGFDGKTDNPTIGLILCAEKNEAILRKERLRHRKVLRLG